MVLLCAEGLQSKEVAVRLGVHEHTVGMSIAAERGPGSAHKNGDHYRPLFWGMSVEGVATQQPDGIEFCKDGT